MLEFQITYFISVIRETAVISEYMFFVTVSTTEMKRKKSRKKEGLSESWLNQYSLGFTVRWVEPRDKNITSFSNKIGIL